MKNRIIADLVGYGALALIIISWSLMLQPSSAEIRAETDKLCPESKVVIVNGDVVGCTNDKPSARNTWRPDHDYKEIELRPIRESDDSWMDRK